jgi:hypothetical protein
VKRKIILLDLDNCIADDLWRRPFIDETQHGNARWHRYHLHAKYDALGNEDLLKTRHEIVVVTGRPIRYRDLTMMWLDKYQIVPLALLMRAEGDHGPAAMMKVRLAQDYLIQTDNRVMHAYDDRHDVIEAYRMMGFNATQRAINKTEVPIGY